MKNENIKKVIPYVVIILVYIIFLIRSFYSFCWSDESFYISMIDRIYRGDRMFVDEWHPSQIYSFFLLPVYALYVTVKGREGIYLAARLFFCFCGFTISCYSYTILKRKFDIVGSLITVLFYSCYNKKNIMGVTYYSFGLSVTVLAIVTALHAFTCNNETKRKILLICCGIFSAMSILTNPYLALAYVIIMVAGILMIKENRSSFFWVFAGNVICGIPFLIYLISQGSLKDIFAVIPYLLNDQQHQNVSLIQKAKNVIIECADCYYLYTRIIFGFICVTILIRAFEEYSKKGKKLHPVLCSISNKLVDIKKWLLFINLIMFAFFACKINVAACAGALLISLFILPVYFLYGRFQTNFILLYAYGIMYAFLWGMASAYNELGIMLAGFILSGAAAILFLQGIDVEGVKIKRKHNIVVMIFLAFSICVSVKENVCNVYRDGTLESLSTRIEEGPAKGLLTTKEHALQYEEIYHYVSDNLSGDKEDSIFFSKLLPWAYLCTDMRCGVYTTWRIYLDDERLEDYCKIHEDNWPDVIVVLDEKYENSNENNMPGGPLWDYILQNNYCSEETPIGLIFRKNM